MSIRATMTAVPKLTREKWFRFNTSSELMTSDYNSEHETYSAKSQTTQTKIKTIFVNNNSMLVRIIRNEQLS